MKAVFYTTGCGKRTRWHIPYDVWADQLKLTQVEYGFAIIDGTPLQMILSPNHEMFNGCGTVFDADGIPHKGSGVTVSHPDQAHSGRRIERGFNKISMPLPINWAGRVEIVSHRNGVVHLRFNVHVAFERARTQMSLLA